MSERITEAELRQLEMLALWTRQHQSDLLEKGPAALARATAEVRRLRGLIVGTLTPDTVVERRRSNPWATPTCSITAPDPAVSDLVAEADAIRAEQR